jgi:hypothetical protein
VFGLFNNLQVIYSALDTFVWLTFFSGCEVYICDFHREQCWERWVSMTKHGVTSVKDQVLAYLRQIASATTVQEYYDAVKRLTDSSIWKQHASLQQWFEKTWLPEHKVCPSDLANLNSDYVDDNKILSNLKLTFFLVNATS